MTSIHEKPLPADENLMAARPEGVTARRGWVVAVDGPAGVGKTTVARGAAAALGCAHLDTGAFYRAATLIALVHRLDLSNEAELTAAAAAADLDYRGGKMLVEGIDMSSAVRTEAVTAQVSRVSALAGLRIVLVRRQRQWLASRGGRAVVEGRDIGTAVFPGAALKVFLTARPEVRAARRASQDSAEERAVREALERRDRIDSTRRASPLARAEDAVVIDTSDASAEQVVSEVLRLCSERGIGPAPPG